MVLWRYGVVPLWCCGVMVLWHYGVVEFGPHANCLLDNSLTNLVILCQDIDPDLKQKADLERSRNKQRQRLRASGRQPAKKPAEADRSLFEKKAWKRAQSDIDALLDPMATTSSTRYIDVINTC